jgi:hypothetical protein
MPQRLIFQVTSPLGYRVVLTRDRWREIVRYKHPALDGHERQLRSCVEAPKLIRQSAKDPSVHMYYATAGQVQLCVVVAPEQEDQRFVVTAYFTKNIKKGTELWTS